MMPTLEDTNSDEFAFFSELNLNLQSRLQTCSSFFVSRFLNDNFIQRLLERDILGQS